MSFDSREIRDGLAFKIEDAQPSISLVNELRNANMIPINGARALSLLKA